MSLIEIPEKTLDQATQSWNGIWSRAWPTAVVVLCTMLTPIWYPSPEFGSGLTFFQTSVLVTRNMTLIGLWVFLIRLSLSDLKKSSKQPH